MDELSVGTIIQCPSCKKDLYINKESMHRGEIFLASQFSGLGDVPEPVPGSPMSCPDCKTSLSRQAFRGFQVHTKQAGWV